MKLIIINEETYLKDKKRFQDIKFDCIYNDLLDDNLNSLTFDDDDYPHILHLTFLQIKSMIYKNIQEDIDFCCVIKDEYIDEIINFGHQFNNVDVSILK